MALSTLSPLSLESGPCRPPSRTGTRPRWWPGAVVVAATVVGLVHVLAVSHHYYVGSFDDDANYILTAKAFLAGKGLTSYLPSGDAVVAGYPPGFPVLLVPLLWLFPHTYVPLRLLSAAFFAAMFPLTWYYLGRRSMPDVVRVGVMVLLALNPVAATYGSMVMAEMPFVCCALVLFIAIDRWEESPRTIGPLGVVVVLLGAECVWLKEAGLGLVLGVGLWFALRRRWARALAVIGGMVVLLVPVVIARLVDHVPLAGSRYSQELGDYYQGGLVSRLVDVVPHGSLVWLNDALPKTLIAYGAPLPQGGFWHHAIVIVWLQIPVLTVVGLIVTVVRHRDVAVLAVPAYAAETALWPQVNERRVILVLPVLLAWYLLGVWTVVRGVRAGLRRWTWSGPPVTAAFGILGVVLVLLPLSVQSTRDYLFGVHQDSSRPIGSRYMEVLAALGTPHQVVESDYRYTTALLTGHRTADTAFLAEIAHKSCSDAVARTALRSDDAGYLLIGALNKPDLIDNACLYGLATTQPWAVRILRTSRDEGSVFELIGPGTDHPDLVNLMTGARLTGSSGLVQVPVRPAGRTDHPGAAATTAVRDGTGTLTWSWGRTRAVTQVSVGEAGLTAGTARGVALQVQRPDGQWVGVRSAPGAVGDGAGHEPFLLATLPPGTDARGVRVVVHGTGRAIALDVDALGPAERSPT